MVVVGSRGGGGFASLLAGSVSVQVATHAPCLVTVVRGRPDNDTGPVVVGVDGSPSADFAIGVAFEQAARRGCALRIVRAFGTPVSPWTLGITPLRYDYDKVATHLNDQLVTHIAGWRNKYSDVPVQLIVERSSAGALLTAMSWRAQLVVVGTRGHGAPGSLLLGSVGLQLLHHAECPVLIARANVTPATNHTPSALP
jgi:nucleotide-binding universal stress UspA family protein